MLGVLYQANGSVRDTGMRPPASNRAGAPVAEVVKSHDAHPRHAAFRSRPVVPAQSHLQCLAENGIIVGVNGNHVQTLVQIALKTSSSSSTSSTFSRSISIPNPNTRRRAASICSRPPSPHPRSRMRDPGRMHFSINRYSCPPLAWPTQRKCSRRRRAAPSSPAARQPFAHPRA